MKNLSLQVFTAILFCFAGTTVSARTFQPSTQNAFTGANTYCQGDVANILTFTYNTCSAGGGGSVGGSCSITWYYNVTNVTTTGTATIVSGPTAFNSATTATATQTFTPSTAAAGTFYYFCVITRNTFGCGGGTGSTLTSTTQLVTVNALPTAVVASGAGTFCGSATITAANGGSGTIYYQGLTSNGTSTVTPSASQIVATSGTYFFRAQSAAGCWSTQGSVTVSINPFPAVFNLSGDGSYCAGTAGVDVQLSGSEAGVNYQLYNGAATSGGVVAGGATPLDFGFQTAGVYTASATNATSGCSSNMTGSATITSDPLPIVYTVSGGGTYCSNGTGLFIDLSHSDVGINYQLYNGAATMGAPLAGSASGISFGPETAAGVYTVMATNATTSCTNNMAGSATINVLPAPTQYTMTGGGSYCIGGAGKDIGLSTSDVGTNYQLYNGAATVGSLMPGTGNPLDFGFQTVAGTYSVLATSTATGCSGPMANTVDIIVNPLPTVYTVGGGGAYCMGGAGSDITLSGSDVGVNYQVYLGAATAGATVAGTGAIPTDLGFQTAAGTYTVVATDGIGCSSNMNGSATVSINPLPAVFSMTGSGAFCAGGAGIDIGLSGSATGVNYQLFNGATFVNTFPGTNNPLDFGFQTVAGTYTVTAIDATTFCSSAMSGAATVTVNPLPAVYTISAGGGYCMGGSGVDLTLSGSDVGVNYQLYNGAAATGSPVPGTGAVPTDLGMQTAAGTYTVFATNPSTGCTNNMTGSATVTINPLPLVYSVTGGGGYCTGGAGVNVGLNGSQPGINYQLYDNGVIIGAPFAGTGSSFNFGLEAAAGTYTVLATDASTLCTSNMFGSQTVVINPLPTPYTVTGGGQYCAGGTGFHVGLSNSVLNISYQLYNGAAVVNTLPGTGSALDFGVFTAGGTYTVFATNTITSCTNNMTGNAIITVNPLPTAYTVTGGGSYCAGGAGFHVGLSNSDIGTNYQLYRSGSPVGAAVGGIGGALDFGVFTAAGNYLVVATNTTTTCQNLMSGSATITINPLPGPINGVTSICFNSLTTLSDDTTGGAWSSNDITIATINSSTGLMTGAGVGMATITYTLPTSCAITTPVTVNALPVVAAIMGITNECAGFGNTLTDATATGVWSSTNPTMATIDPVTGLVNGLTAGTTTISYTVTNVFGCVNAATTPDTVNALPIVDAIGGSMNVCLNSTVTLTDDSTGGVWTSGDMTIATIDPSLGTLTGIAAGTVNITYTITSPAGCVTFVTANETVNPLPDVSAINGPVNVCAGLTISLSDTTLGGVWSSSDNTIATVTSTGTVNGVAPGSAAISYTVTNGLGCSNSAIDNVTVGTAMPATAILPAGSSTLCGGSPINLVTSPASGGLTYQWSINGNDIAGATNGNYMSDTTGVFTVTLNNGTCSQTITGVTIIAPPHPVISYNSAGNYLFTGTFASYQWYKNGTPITGANSSILSAPAPGDYKVVVDDANGCFVTSATYTIPGGSGGGGGGGGGTGVSNTPSVTGVKIYPNPATSTLQIDAPVTVNVSVISPDGKVVIQQKQATSIDVSQLADGLYIIMVYDENSTLLKTEKFAKIK